MPRLNHRSILRLAASSDTGTDRSFTDEESNMSLKYYTHFVLHDGEPKDTSEYRGVVEVSRSVASTDFRLAASVLARKFECAPNDVKVLQWAPLH
jgi:hypothetical protein